MMQGFHPFRTNDTVFQKTVAINDFYLRGPDAPYPLGQIQSQGRTHGVMAQTVVPWIPLWAYDAGSSRGVDWLAMSEDLPQPTTTASPSTPDGRIRLHYRPNNVARAPAAGERNEADPPPARLLDRDDAFARQQEHHASVRHAVLRHRSARVGARSLLPRPRRRESVRRRRSFFPSSAAVNPGLTIAAQALRVADHIKATELTSVT